MLTILGPAKTIDTSPHGITESYSFPEYIDRAEELVDQLRQYSIPKLKILMQVSDKLATTSTIIFLLIKIGSSAVDQRSICGSQ